MADGDIRAVSFMRAGRDAVWDALTNPDTITAFHPTGMVAAALPEGGHELKRPDDGATFIREAMVAQETGKRLELTFEPVWAAPPEGGSTVAFEIDDEAECCRVTVTQTNCATFGIGDNWDRFLASMKSHLETGTGLRIPPAA